MKAEKFIINDRFIADINRNMVFDKKENIETRLEPRLVRLLCTLVDKQGEVVTRELLIKEIWNNYLGANEGLSQAISFLRKLLDDGEKNMIKTLPKKGYIFHATIRIPSEKKTRKLSLVGIKRIPVAAFLIFLCINFFYIIRNIIPLVGKKQLPDYGSLKQISERDAENQSVLIFKTDSTQQSEKLRK